MFCHTLNDSVLGEGLVVRTVRKGTAVGEVIWLELPEMHAAGDAEVRAISACPALEPGSGPVITGTFRHEADELVELRVSGQPDPLRCTAEHPFWSATRHEFVAASALRPGEEIETATGTPALLTSITPRAGPETVYGLEVYAEHVYHVGPNGLLVHNASGKKIDLGGVPDNARYPTNQSRFVEKPQKGADLLRRKPGDAIGIREHLAKHPDVARTGRDYLQSAIDTAIDAKYVRYDKPRGSPRLQFFKQVGEDGSGLFTVTSVDGRTIFTHFSMDAKAAARSGFVPRARRGE